MRFYSFICLFFLSFAASAQPAAATAEELPTLLEHLRGVPLFLTGKLRFEKDHRLFHEEKHGFKYIQGFLKANKDIKVRLSKTELKIETIDGLQLLVGPIKLNVTSLTYNNTTGKVVAHSRIFKDDLGDHFVESIIARKIEEEFKDTLAEAFRQLMTVRQQRSFNDAAEVINSILNLFDDPNPAPGKKPGKPLPTIRGVLTLNSILPSSQTVKLGAAVADLAKDEILAISAMVKIPPRERVQFRGFMLNTSIGILLRPASKDPDSSIVHGTIQNFSLTQDHGLQVYATNGADDALTAGIILVEVVKSATVGGSGQPIGQLQRSSIVQHLIEGRIDSYLENFTTKYRQDLLHAGVSAELIEALSQPQPPIGQMPFFYPHGRRGF